MNIQQKLERKLSAYLGLKNAVLFSSCRNALHVLLLSLTLKETDEVIIQSFICDSLPEAIRKAGGKVIPVEVNPATFNLDAKVVEKKVTKNTRAVVFVHTYGNPSGIQEMAELCTRKNIILIEDIAHALGASVHGKLAGTFGDYAVYSFTKQMVNIGGGAIITNNEVNSIHHVLAKSLAFEMPNLWRKNPIPYLKRLLASLYETRAFYPSKLLIDYARKNVSLKINNLLDNHYGCNKLEAYLSYWQLSRLNKIIESKKRNFNLIKSFCAEVQNGLNTQAIDEDAQSSYNYISLIFPNQKKRDEAVRKSRLLLPPWPGSILSEMIAFVPNNPRFKEKDLGTITGYYEMLKSEKLKCNP